MTQPEEKEWLPMEETFLITYRDGDMCKILIQKESNIGQAIFRFLGGNHPIESIISIIKIS